MTDIVVLIPSALLEQYQDVVYTHYVSDIQMLMQDESGVSITVEVDSRVHDITIGGRIDPYIVHGAIYAFIEPI